MRRSFDILDCRPVANVDVHNVHNAYEDRTVRSSDDRAQPFLSQKSEFLTNLEGCAERNVLVIAGDE